jgi:3-oxoacyl-[acyl-carrier-protein] synthase II
MPASSAVGEERDMEERSQPLRVVVAGVGAVTSQGAGVEELWAGVRAGRVAIRPVKNLPMDGYRTRLGGEVQAPATPEHDYRRPPGFRDPVLDFALVAAEEAMARCGLGVGRGAEHLVPPERWGVVAGSCNAGLVSGERALFEQMAGRIPDWRLYLLVSPQAIAEALSHAFGLTGPVLSVNTACASGAHAIGHGVELIRTGHADAVLVGGSDCFSDILFAGFNSLESLATGPAAPYSKDRDGLSLGEGSGMLVLVRADIAAAAGIPVLAEVLGYGLSADGYHPTAPHPQGRGAARAITAAIGAAGVTPEAVQYVNGHGTGTAKNDPAETAAIRAALGEAAERTALSSTKSMVGHLLGAAGAVEGIVTVLALADQVAPPTAGFTSPDPHCRLDVVPNDARPLAMDVAASNNFAFAGANACVVFSRDGGHPAGPAPRAEEPVVVTGLAAFSPAGSGVDPLWRAYRAGLTLGEPEGGLRVGRALFDPAEFVGARQRRRMDRLTLLAVAASRTALVNAGLAAEQPDRTRIGVVLGTGLGPMESMAEFTTPLHEGGAAAANPAVFPNTVYNAAAGQVATLLGTTGVTSTLTASHAAGAVALCVAHDLLAAGAADAVVVPAVDTLPQSVLAGYRRIPLFAEPGFTLTEGGFALVLERASAAAARGARPLATFAGYGITSDARGLGRWDPHGAGLERAMRTALDHAGLSPAEVSAVWASAAGLPPADAPELAAVGRVFGAGAPLEAPKRLLGEPVGAGAHQSAVLALTGWVESGARGPALVNSSSLGGTHVAFVLLPWKDNR